MKLIIGVDPGAIPAIVAISGEGELLEIAHNLALRGCADRTMPERAAMFVRNWIKKHGGSQSCNTKIVCEAVSIRKGEGAISALKYASSFYVLQGIAGGLRIPFESVHPRTWKKKLGSDKKKSVKLASEIWPSYKELFKADHNKAEAALIAKWSINQHL